MLKQYFTTKEIAKKYFQFKNVHDVRRLDESFGKIVIEIFEEIERTNILEIQMDAIYYCNVRTVPFLPNLKRIKKLI